jgi:site-specific recombinase XerD
VLTVKEIEQILGAIDNTSVTGLRNFTMIVLFCATGAPGRGDPVEAQGC